MTDIYKITRSTKIKKDYCTAFPEKICGVNISACCKQHDNDCGMAGSFNFARHQINFYSCLKSKLTKKMALLITMGGAVICIIKSPWLIYKKLKYRITVDPDSVAH